MINATNIIIQNSSGDIVGQMEMTLTFVGAPIDITNKSFDQWVEIFDGELGIKQLQISGTIVYNNDDQFRKVREDAFNGNLDTYTINYMSNGVITEVFTADMMPNGLNDALPHGDKLTTSLTFLSSGIVSIAPPEVFALVTETYVMIGSDSLNVTQSFSVPIDGTTSYIDNQTSVIGDFTFELDSVVIAQDQVPEVLNSNMITGAGSTTIITITEVTQDQVPEVLASNMITGTSSVTVITITEITQDQKADILNSNMTTGNCSATVTTP